MTQILRKKINNFAAWLIMLFIAIVFVFYGVFDPSRGRGGLSTASVGEVNGDALLAADFNRMLNQRTDAYLKAGISQEQLKVFKLREAVFENMVNSKILAQEADKKGLMPSENAVREEIKKIPAFQTNGGFDRIKYRDVLAANGLNSAKFEQMIKDDLVSAEWEKYFSQIVKVSDVEIEREYLAQADTRGLKYVFVTSELAKKWVKISDSEIQTYMADKGKMERVKAYFESRQNIEYKDKKLEQVQTEIVKTLLANEKRDEINKVRDEFGKKVLTMVTASEAGKKLDSQVEALFKDKDLKVQSDPKFNRKSYQLVGVGPVEELKKDLFVTQTLDPQKGLRAKKYDLMGGTLIVWVESQEKADLTKLDSTKRQELAEGLVSGKKRMLFSTWLTQVRKTAKVSTNPIYFRDEGT